MAKARKRVNKSRFRTGEVLRVSRSTLGKVSKGRVIVNYQPTKLSVQRMEMLMVAISVVRLDESAQLPAQIPDTYEALYDRAVEQFLELYDAEPNFQVPVITGTFAKRRGIWIRGDLVLRVEKIAADSPYSVGRIIERAIESYVDYHTRDIDKRLITSFSTTAQKILDASEWTGKELRERERKARKVMRTGHA
jgi:hypothetical protein